MSGVLKPFHNIKLYYLVTGFVNTWNKSIYQNTIYQEISGWKGKVEGTGLMEELELFFSFFWWAHSDMSVFIACTIQIRGTGKESGLFKDHLTFLLF